MSKPVCYVMVGLPACGKSTLVASVSYMDPDVFVYSTDNYIDNVAAARGETYSEVFASVIKEATSAMNDFLSYAIEDKRNVIWDQTNLSTKKRKSIIEKMKLAGYEVDCVCITKPETDEELGEWSRRLASRPGKNIPEHIIESMKETYVYPATEEGFSYINFYDMFGGLTGIDYEESYQ